MYRASIGRIGYGLIIGPAVGGLYTLMTTFNIVVFSITLVLLTIAVTLIIVSYLPDPGNDAGAVEFVSEMQVQQKIDELIRDKEIYSADFLTAGVASRKTMYLHLVKSARKPIRVLVQNPRVAVSDSEKRTTIKSLADIALEIGKEIWNSPSLKLHSYDDHASLRLTILRDGDGKPAYAILGWYTYRDRNSYLTGSRNPSVFVSKQMNSLLKFAEEEFNRKWAQSTPIDFDAVLASNRDAQQSENT